MGAVSCTRSAFFDSRKSIADLAIVLFATDALCWLIENKRETHTRQTRSARAKASL